MAFNGSGTFNRLYNWVDDRVNSINIRADKMDGEQDGIAAGLTNCVTKDGQTTITANLKMSNFKHTGVAPASARNQYLDVAASQDGKINHAVSVSGSGNSVVLTMYPTIAAYTTGMSVRWISTEANTGSANMAIDGLSAIRLITGTSATLVGNEIASAAMIHATYQGPGKFSLQTVNLSTAVIEAGTVMCFFQAAAPTFWTQVTDHNDKAMRVVSGTGGGTGGSVAFETAFASQAVAGNTDGTAITEAQMPAHSHTDQLFNADSPGSSNPRAGASSGVGTMTTSTVGSGDTHLHAFTGTAIDMDVSYINMILAAKD